MNCVHKNVNVQYMYVVCNIKVLCKDKQVVYIDVYRIAFRLHMYAHAAVIPHSHKSFVLSVHSNQ